jgi:hypothetical protein
MHMSKESHLGTSRARPETADYCISLQIPVIPITLSINGFGQSENC